MCSACSDGVKPSASREEALVVAVMKDGFSLSREVVVKSVVRESSEAAAGRVGGGGNGGMY